MNNQVNHLELKGNEDEKKMIEFNTKEIENLKSKFFIFENEISEIKKRINSLIDVNQSMIKNMDSLRKSSNAYSTNSTNAANKATYETSNLNRNVSNVSLESNQNNSPKETNFVQIKLEKNFSNLKSNKLRRKMKKKHSKL